MKRLKLVIFVLLISLNANSQWYSKYGVNDPNLLTTQQLNDALSDSKSMTGVGGAFSFLGILGIWGGFALMESAYDEPEWDVGVGRWIGGFFLTTISFGLEITGIVFLVTGGTRSSEIKRILNITDVKVGLIGIPGYDKSLKLANPVIPGLALTFHF